MSGEQRVRIAALIALVCIFALFIVASGAVAEEKEDDNFKQLIEELNKNQNTNGSWDEVYEVTTMSTYANSFIIAESGDSEDNYNVTIDAMDWTMDNYIGDSKAYTCGNSVSSESIHSDSYILLINVESDSDGWADFQVEVDYNIQKYQWADGSWNGDPGDTGIATYSRIYGRGARDEVSAKGAQWLLDNEDKENLSWGSISDDSKAILALDSAGYDMWEEISALALKQKPDGSFGGIEDTSWAVIALSTDLNEENMERMEKALAWLRSQEYDNNEDLANAALAEQYYEKAKRDWDPPDNALIEKKGDGNGLIPPPWMFALSIFIITAIALGYFLFARLEKDAIMSGIRKDLYSYIEKHPGEHLAHLTREFDISSSSTRYHLSVLEGMDQIVSHKMGKYKRFYINKNGYSKYTNGNGYKHIMSALKNVTARKIVKFILLHPETNQKSVSNALKIHPSTVNWHAERLREAEVLLKCKRGKEIVYSLNEDVQVRKVIGILEGSVA